PVKKAKAKVAQQVTFSTYKNRHSAKIIVGVIPRGRCSYLSEACIYAASDCQIIQCSNVVTQVDRGD
ncbi:hypothetical protein LSH36_760g00003, partial [Paralvinella palmiformis]